MREGEGGHIMCIHTCTVRMEYMYAHYVTEPLEMVAIAHRLCYCRISLAGQQC